MKTGGMQACDGGSPADRMRSSFWQQWGPRATCCCQLRRGLAAWWVIAPSTPPYPRRLAGRLAGRHIILKSFIRRKSIYFYYQAWNTSAVASSARLQPSSACEHRAGLYIGRTLR